MVFRDVTSYNLIFPFVSEQVPQKRWKIYHTTRLHILEGRESLSFKIKSSFSLHFKYLFSDAGNPQEAIIWINYIYE